MEKLAISLKDMSASLDLKSAKILKDWKRLSSQEFYAKAWSTGKFDYVTPELKEIRQMQDDQQLVAAKLVEVFQEFEDQFLSLPQYNEIDMWYFSVEVNDHLLRIISFTLVIVGILTSIVWAMTDPTAFQFVKIALITYAPAIFFYTYTYMLQNRRFPVIAGECFKIHAHVGEFIGSDSRGIFDRSCTLMSTLEEKMIMADSKTMTQLLRVTEVEIKEMIKTEKKLSDQVSMLQEDNFLDIETAMQKMKKDNYIIKDDYHSLKLLLNLFKRSLKKVRQYEAETRRRKATLEKIIKLLPKLGESLKSGQLYQSIEFTKLVQDEVGDMHKILQNLYEKVLDSQSSGIELMNGIGDAGKIVGTNTVTIFLIQVCHKLSTISNHKT